MSSTPTVAVAIQTANVTFRGERLHVQAGHAWDASDPLVREFPSLFSTDAKYLRRTEAVVEAATAAPGERRGTRRS